MQPAHPEIVYFHITLSCHMPVFSPKEARGLHLEGHFCTAVNCRVCHLWSEFLGRSRECVPTCLRSGPGLQMPHCRWREWCASRWHASPLRAMHLACPVLSLFLSLTAISRGCQQKPINSLAGALGLLDVETHFQRCPLCRFSEACGWERVCLPGPRILSDCLWISAGISIRKQSASDTSRHFPSDR